MNLTARLLYIVVGDAKSRKELGAYLQFQGYRVATMASVGELLQCVRGQEPHLILLDADLPGGDGTKVWQKLREKKLPIPLILMSARCDAVDRVIGLEMGADDFVGKPYVLREIYARVKAVLRRSAWVAADAVSNSDVLVVGARTFSPATRRIGSHGQDVTLSEVDSCVLAELVAHPEAVISRQRLLVASRRNPADLLPAAVDRTVFRLRKLIETDASAPRYIRSVRGHGYVYSPTGA